MVHELETDAVVVLDERGDVPVVVARVRLRVAHRRPTGFERDAVQPVDLVARVDREGEVQPADPAVPVPPGARLAGGVLGAPAAHGRPSIDIGGRAGQVRGMAGLAPYVHFDGRAREALTFYREVFGGELSLATFAEFGRVDGPAEAIAHGVLSGPVDLYGADLADGAPTPSLTGVMFALLGAAEPATLRAWFEALSDGGVVVDPLQARTWGAHDGQVRDRFGVTWLIGYED